MALKGSLYRATGFDGSKNNTFSKSTGTKYYLKSIIGLQFTILAESGWMKDFILPWPAEGNYYFDSTDHAQLGSFIYLTEEDKKWVIHCKKPAFFRDNSDRIIYRAELVPGCTYTLVNVSDTYVIYAEFCNEFSNMFHNYRIDRFTDITIGRGPECDIQYENTYVSRLHAVLRWDKDSWIIIDMNSSNGIYVNNKRAREARLSVGDRIFIVGLRINIGIGFISVNDENERVVFSEKLRAIKNDGRTFFLESPGKEEEEQELFNRMPRKREIFNPEPIIIEAPPMQLNANGIPLFLRMGGSMVRGTTALMAGYFTSVISSVLFPMLTQRYTEKQRKEYEAKRQELYGKYLRDKITEIKTEAKTESVILNRNYPDLSTILRYTEDKKKLWERRNVDDDFLTLRIGSGTIPMQAERNYPRRRFEMDEDNLLDKMYEIAEKPVYLKEAPIVFSFVENYVSSVVGRHETVKRFIMGLIFQLTILHSYDEVKTIFLITEEDLKNVGFIKYLPHIWNDQRDFRFLATNVPEALKISEYLKKELQEDITKPRQLKDMLKQRPYYVVFAFDKKVFDSMEIMKDVLQSEKNCSLSIITAFKDLPKECMTIFDLKESGVHSIVYLNQIDSSDKFFKSDIFVMDEALASIKEVSNTYLRVVSQAYSLPKMITFLEMFGVGKVEQLDPINRWKENNPVQSLSTPIGIGTDGTLFTLDLHEKYQGPHGLIAGMTGSGKSEFIITFILSMAVSYSPEEVAFILIDYKGGGLARAFEDETREIYLPHLVGTITNLDGAAIQRSMKAIQSELLRRQKLFNKAKSIVDESSIDIYEYQKLYRNKKVSEPLPHLFLISDEFAELKKQEPEFMDKLISTARIGRSLGVHLILATQKPSGVVNEQIWSNSKFRVCLKVQDKYDSTEMLKRPEAAELKDTGRFYLQVGYNELFALGQSAWCGADYEPEENVIVQKDEEIHVLDHIGQVIHRAKPEKKKSAAKGSQLDAIVRYLKNVSFRYGFRTNRLWKPPLSVPLSFETLMRYEVSEKKEAFSGVKVGLIDDPENQDQFPLCYDVLKSRNLMIIGDQGCGKTTMLQTVLFELLQSWSPDKLNIYAIDFSSKMLRMFNKTPHFGEILEEEDEKSFAALFDMIHNIINERKELFASLEISSFEEARELRQLPVILMIIDNFAGFIATKAGNACQSAILNDLKTSASYGIKYIITCNRLNEIPTRIRQELGECFTLQMKDKYEYGDALGCRCSYVPSVYPGRGLCCHDGRPLEYQAAMLWPDLKGVERSKRLKEEIQRINEMYKNGRKAKRIPSVSESETYEEFTRSFSENRIPLGFSIRDNKPVALPLRQFSRLQFYFGNPLGISPVLENVLFAVQSENMELTIISKEKMSLFDERSEIHIDRELWADAEIISLEGDGIILLWRRLTEEIKRRKDLLLQYCKENGLDAKRKDIYADTHAYMRAHVKPICILFEEFSEFCRRIDQASAMVFSKIFGLFRQYQIYSVGCFYPESTFYSNDSVYKSFSDEDIIMLFGGRLMDQDLCKLPPEYTTAVNAGAYDRFLMKYRGGFYPLRMPCRAVQVEVEESDPDDRSII